MELLILADKFIIYYTPLWMFVLLLTGLFFFFLSKLWRKKYKENNRFGFAPSVLFIVSFIFLMGGIHFFVYKIVLNKDKIILFNVQDFNRQLEWKKISKVEYMDQQQILITMKNMQYGDMPIVIDLERLGRDSMDKVKILIAYKLKQSQKPVSTQREHNTKIKKIENQQ